MEIQTKPLFKIRTPRVKCISGLQNYPDVLVCLFTGDIMFYDSKTLHLKRSAHVCDVPIRTGVIVQTKDWIILGNDEGCIVVVDLGNLSVIETIKAHDDFIRKIIVDEHNQRIVTVSDDNRTKLWSYSNGIIQINKYKDSKHFVMDACFYPTDQNYFFTASLDGKVRMYSVINNKVLRVFKGHEKGINSMTFISSENFITGSDDSTVMVWDVKRSSPVAVLKGHTKNVNRVYALKSGFATCSEDNTVRFWSKEFKTVEMINLQGRVWDIFTKDGKIFIGSDEELCLYQEINSSVTVLMRDNRIFYNQGSTILCTKIDELGAYKELGVLEDGFETFRLNDNGKLIALESGDRIEIYSTLGMRKKYSDVGKDLHFTDQDKFVYLKGSKLITVLKSEVESEVEVKEATKLLYADSKITILNTSHTCVYSCDDLYNPLHEFGEVATTATVIGESMVLFGEKIEIYNREFERIGVFDCKVESFTVSDGVIYFSTSNKTFYSIVTEKTAHLYHLKYCPSIIGVKDGILLYYLNSIKQLDLDIDFIFFKKEFLCGGNPTPKDLFREKAISFFESQGLHEKALSLCTDENQKFDILIKLNRLDEALKGANSSIKYEKLGKKYLSMLEFDKAAECFYHSNDLDSLLLTDCFGSKKYLKQVSRKSKEAGRCNLAFLAAYKAGDFETCNELLKSTPFHRAFAEFYRN